jgi:hypothetical protein
VKSSRNKLGKRRRFYDGKAMLSTFLPVRCHPLLLARTARTGTVTTIGIYTMEGKQRGQHNQRRHFLLLREFEQKIIYCGPISIGKSMLHCMFLKTEIEHKQCWPS